jgi:uncharacterized protein YndB with AHSA1/START domain
MPTSSTQLHVYVNAPPAAVYHALTDAAAVATWMVPDGMTSHVHEFDTREGGKFRISLRYDTADGVGKSSAHTDTYHGHFVSLVPDQQVVETMEFETDDPAMQGAMTATFTLSAEGAGTTITAVHDNVPAGIAPADNELGWRMSLEKLARLVEDEIGSPQTEG